MTESTARSRSIDSGDSDRAPRFSELVERLRDCGPVDRDRIIGVEAPLRICPLGAHIDHQGGTVTGMTVNRSVLLAAVPTLDPIFRIESLDFPGPVEVDVTANPKPRAGDWGDYVHAAIYALRAEHEVRHGLRAVVRGDLTGAGLSSSAAVLIAYLLALAEVNDIELGPEEIVTLVQRAENAYVGVASGRLDQSVMVYADPGSLTLIDCSNFSIQQLQAPSSMEPPAIVVAFSGASRSLATSDFNTRVFECREAARRLLELDGQAPESEPLLSHVKRRVFDEMAGHLPRRLRLRATHFFGETQRVEAGVRAWRAGDLDALGALITSSGESSIINYECGTPPLVTLFELLCKEQGVFGARFSGAGFGGSCIAVAAPDACAAIASSVAKQFAQQHPELASSSGVQICRADGPARVFRLVH